MSDEAQLRRSATGESAGATPYGPWKCFHCWEVFANPNLAAMHFGATPDAEPMCKVQSKDWPLAYAYRELEQELARYRAEDSDKDREIHAMRDEHARALRRAEEEGYEKGLRDGMAERGRKLVAEINPTIVLPVVFIPEGPSDG